MMYAITSTGIDGCIAILSKKGDAEWFCAAMNEHSTYDLYGYREIEVDNGWVMSIVRTGLPFWQVWIGYDDPDTPRLSGINLYEPHNYDEFDTEPISQWDKEGNFTGVLFTVQASGAELAGKVARAEYPQYLKENGIPSDDVPPPLDTTSQIDAYWGKK